MPPSRLLSLLVVCLLIAGAVGHVLTPTTASTGHHGGDVSANGHRGGRQQREAFAAFLELGVELATYNKFASSGESIAMLRRAVEQAKTVRRTCPQGDTLIPEGWKSFNAKYLEFLDSVVKHAAWTPKTKPLQSLLTEAVVESEKIVSDMKVEAKECVALEKLADSAIKPLPSTGPSPTARKLLMIKKKEERKKEPPTRKEKWQPMKEEVIEPSVQEQFELQAQLVADLVGSNIEAWLMELTGSESDSLVKEFVESAIPHRIFYDLLAYGTPEIAEHARGAFRKLRSQLEEAGEDKLKQQAAFSTLQTTLEQEIEPALLNRELELQQSFWTKKSTPSSLPGKKSKGIEDDERENSPVQYLGIKDISPNHEQWGTKPARFVGADTLPGLEEYLNSDKKAFSKLEDAKSVVKAVDTHFTFMVAMVTFEKAGQVYVLPLISASDNTKSGHSEQKATEALHNELTALLKDKCTIRKVQVKLDQMWKPCGGTDGGDHNCNGFLHEYVKVWRALPSNPEVTMTLFTSEGKSIIDPSDPYVAPTIKWNLPVPKKKF